MSRTMPRITGIERRPRITPPTLIVSLIVYSRP